MSGEEVFISSPQFLNYLREPFFEFLPLKIEVPEKIKVEMRKTLKSIFNRLSGGSSPSPSSHPAKNKAILIKTIITIKHSKNFDLLFIKYHLTLLLS
jgi:hypothetical protein